MNRMRLLLLSLLALLLPGPRCVVFEDGTGFMDETLFQARARAYLQYATERRDDSPLNAIAHMERDRVDPGYSAPIGQVDVGSWANDFDRIARYLDTRDFGGLYLLNAYLGYGPSDAQPDGHPYLTPAFWMQIRDALFSFKMWYTDATPAVPDPSDPDRDWDDSFYWTENHQILYHAIEYLMGQRHPTDCFTQAGFTPTGSCDGTDSEGRPFERTGQQHMDRARPYVFRWLDDRWEIGWAEWHSNIYYQKDVTPLLTLIEYAQDPEIVTRAAIILDQILLDLAMHTRLDTFGVTHGRSAMKDKWWGPRNDTWGIVHLLFRQQDALEFFSRGDPGATLLARARNYRPPQVVIDAGTSSLTFVDRERHSVFIDETAQAPDAPLPFVGPFHGQPGYLPNLPDDDPEHAFDVDFLDPGNEQGEPRFTFWWGLGAWTAWQVVPLTVSTGDVYNLWNTSLLSDFQALRSLLGPLDQPVPVANIGIGQTLALQLAPLATVGLLKEANTYTYRTPDYLLSTVQDYRKGMNVGQVHAWNLTIDPLAMVFTTHPMNALQPPSEWISRDEGEPGYWTGSASSPRSAQHENLGIHLYSPAYPDGGAIGFFDYQPVTHAWFPRDAFDEVVSEAHWTFGRRGDVYVALYSWRATSWQDYPQEELDVLNGVLAGEATFTQSFDLVADGPPPPGFDGPSIAPQGPDNVWLVEVGTAAEYGDFGAFRAAILAAPLTVVATPGNVAANQQSGSPFLHQHFDVSYGSPSQGVVSFGWSADLIVAGETVPIHGYPRFDNPWMRMGRGASQAMMYSGPFVAFHDWQAGARRVSRGEWRRKRHGVPR
jgi:hypothetical protein